MSATFARCQFCGARIELPEFDVAVAGVCEKCIPQLYRASGILTEGGDAKQAPGESLSSPTAESGDAPEQSHD